MIAYCLGVIFTFCSVGISAWVVSRMTVVDALRNLPESERPERIARRDFHAACYNVEAYWRDSQYSTYR